MCLKCGVLTLPPVLFRIGTSLRTSQILMPRSPMTGTMRWTESGSRPWLPTLIIRCSPRNYNAIIRLNYCFVYVLLLNEAFKLFNWCRHRCGDFHNRTKTHRVFETRYCSKLSLYIQVIIKHNLLTLYNYSMKTLFCVALVLQGEWKPNEIDNPAYKGKWVHPEIDNPEYTADPDIYKYDSIGVIGLDLWQVTYSCWLCF